MLLYALTVVAASGQPQGSKAPESTDAIRPATEHPPTEDAVRFRMLSLNPLPETLFYRDAAGIWSLPREAREARAISDPMWIVPDDRVRFERRSAEGFSEVVSVEAPDDSDYFLVVIAPVFNEYRARSYDLNLDSQPLDTARFINLAPMRLGLAIGDQQVTLAPGEQRLLRLESGQRVVAVRILVLENGERRQIHSGRYQTLPGSRLLLFGTMREPDLDEDVPYEVLVHRDQGTAGEAPSRRTGKPNTTR